jgi:glycosyltransferase involved in cell wall biosynthesis
MELVNFINKLRLSSHIVGIVARLEVQKRIDVSLEIAKIFFQNHKSVYFLYFGDGPLENEMKALADKMGINNNVKFMGYIPNIKYYIKYFDVLLFTSDWEGLPLTLWESMAAGVPIVSTDVGGIREIIEKEKCGLIFSKNALSEGAAAIEKVVLDKELKNRLGKNGLEAVKNKYNISSFIKSIEKIYDSIISE